MNLDPQGTPAQTLQPLSRFAPEARARVRGILFDIDDTLTTEGRLTATAYAATERLHEAGLLVVPITGRPAGWCDHFARMWPVDAVVGENGAFYFRYDAARRKLTKRFMAPQAERTENRRRLEALKREILAAVPGTGVASDQLYREADLAIDYREDVEPLPAEAVARIVALFEAAGATAKVSSIHVNGWFGDYDKLTTTRVMLAECFGVDLDADKEMYVFVGDSPNDAPMFAAFPNAVGVANLRDFEDRLTAKPAFITRARAGAGFAELAAALLDAR
ncbi:MAG: HAD-IIB family hydrolase [Proteobacteria bacterium]|nr:HAD-IIB family hydrolase [Pseudomonadota bacterium]